MVFKNLIEYFRLPPDAFVDKRVPKKLLVENGSQTAADKRLINEGVEELKWVASLKPTTIGVPAYHDDSRKYLEIALLAIILREKAKVDRLLELVHRAIPYPSVLMAQQVGTISVSLAHKRWSQSEAGQVVLDGCLAEVRFDQDDLFNKITESPTSKFLHSIALSALPRKDMMSLYQGWMDCALALQACTITGIYKIPQDIGDSAARRSALETHEQLKRRIAGLRSQAKKESQIARRVDLNLEIKQLEQQLCEVKRVL